MFVYADNAATTAVSKTALDAMLPYLTEHYGNPSSLYAFAQDAKTGLEGARKTIADILGADDPSEIYFTSGGSEADNQAIRSAAYFGARKGKKHLISTKFEHHAVLHTLDKLRKEGFEVTLLDVHEDGVIRLEDVAAHVYHSPYYFSKLFKKYQGIGFNAWVNQQRMASAKELLCHSDWSIASIARNLGFSQTSYFCKVFRQTYQVTPQAFRQQINAGSQTESF